MVVWARKRARSRGFVAVVILGTIASSVGLAATQVPGVEELPADLRWIQPAPQNHHWMSMAVGDVDGDGLDEVVAGTTTSLHAFDGVAGAPLWTVLSGPVLRIELADLDGDGDLEIVTSGTTQPRAERCFVPRAETSVRVFDAKDGEELVRYEGAQGLASIADIHVEDLQGDGIEDVIVNSYGHEDESLSGLLALDGETLLQAAEPGGTGMVGDEALLWRYDVPPSWFSFPPRMITYQPDGFDAPVVYFAGERFGWVYALDGPTGEPVWIEHAKAHRIFLADVMGDAEPEILTRTAIFDPATGERLWGLSSLDLTGASSSIAYGLAGFPPGQPGATTVIAGAHDVTEDSLQRRVLWGLDADTRTHTWTIVLEENRVRMVWPPSIRTADIDRDGTEEAILSQGDGLYLPDGPINGEHHPRLLVIDPKAGKIVWEQWLPSSNAWRFDAGDLDGHGNLEIVSGTYRAIMAFEPSFEDLGRTSDRYDGQSATAFFCMTPD